MTEFEEMNFKAYVEHLEALRKIETERTAIIQANFLQIVQVIAAGSPEAPQDPANKREWIAVNAMNSLLSISQVEDGDSWPDPMNIAANAVRYADALTKRLKEETK